MNSGVLCGGGEDELIKQLPSTLASAAAVAPQQEMGIDWTLEAEEEKADYAYIRKCGEITMSTNNDECFWLNCIFCPGICLQFDVFVQHIREQHGQDIKTIYKDNDNNNGQTAMAKTTINATKTTNTTEEANNFSAIEFNFDDEYVDGICVAHAKLMDMELDDNNDEVGGVDCDKVDDDELQGGINIDELYENMKLELEQLKRERTKQTFETLQQQQPLPVVNPPKPLAVATEKLTTTTTTLTKAQHTMARTTIKTLRTRSIVNLSLDNANTNTNTDATIAYKDSANANDEDNNEGNSDDDHHDVDGETNDNELYDEDNACGRQRRKRRMLKHVNTGDEAHGPLVAAAMEQQKQRQDTNGNSCFDIVRQCGRRKSSGATATSIFIDKQVNNNNNPYNTRARGKMVNNSNTNTNATATTSINPQLDANHMPIKVTMKNARSKSLVADNVQQQQQQQKQRKRRKDEEGKQSQTERQPKRGRRSTEAKATTTVKTDTPPPIEVDFVGIVVDRNAMLQNGEEETLEPFINSGIGGNCAALLNADNHSAVASAAMAIDCNADVQAITLVSTTPLALAAEGQQDKTSMAKVVNDTNVDENAVTALKTPTRREVLRDKEIITYLLEAYKNNEKLWNPKHPEYKYNAQRHIFNELSEPLLRDMNCQLSGLEIFAILKELKCRYRQELAKCSASAAASPSTNGGRKSRLWYFEKFEFLRHLIEHKRAEREAKLRCEPSKDKPLESNCVLSHIITAYRRREEMWDPQHLDHNTCNKDELYVEISQELLVEFNVTVSGKECETVMQKLRQRYRAELTRLLRCKGLYLPKLWCFDDMEFLRAVEERTIDKRLCKERSSHLHATKPKKSYLKVEAITFATLDDQSHFIEIYRNYTPLWQVDHPDYRSATYRANALNAMLVDVNDAFDIEATLDELQKTIYQMRKDFSSDKQKLLNDDQTTMDGSIYSKFSEFLDQNVGPFRCDVCSAVIKTCDQYKIHKSKHDGTTPFKCTLCGRGFQIQGNLTIHIRRHKRDFPYSCGVCEKRFATSTEVAIHMRSHTGERPYICDLCGKSFKTYSFFDLHQRMHRQESNFHCPVCVRDFYEKNRFTDHMNRHFNIRKHTCQVCKKSFTTAANLRKHAEVHAAIKKYKCDQCDMHYAQAASLRWHKGNVHAEKSVTKNHEQ